MKHRFIITMMLAALGNGAVHAQGVTAQVKENSEQSKAKDVMSVVLYQRFDWGNVVDYGSHWLPIAAYADENSCRTEVQKVTETAAIESKNSDAYLCQTARNDDEESFAKLLIAKRSN